MGCRNVQKGPTFEVMVPRTPASRSFDDGIAMNTKPISGSGEDTFFDALQDAFREAKSPRPAEAGPGCRTPLQDRADSEPPAQPPPPETPHQPEGSWRDWITTW